MAWRRLQRRGGHPKTHWRLLLALPGAISWWFCESAPFSVRRKRGKTWEAERLRPGCCETARSPAGARCLGLARDTARLVSTQVFPVRLNLNGVPSWSRSRRKRPRSSPRQLGLVRANGIKPRFEASCPCPAGAAGAEMRWLTHQLQRLLRRSSFPGADRALPKPQPNSAKAKFRGKLPRAAQLQPTAEAPGQRRALCCARPGL